MLKQLLNREEARLAATLSSIIALRMLGLFMILPVFMVLAANVPGFTPQLGGLAVGIYGLCQAILQQPFGWLSDRWGRRPVLFLGLALFAAGGVLAATADSMTGLIVGRSLQGCGAIAGVAMAFAADFTRPEKRPIIMAIIGIGIGAASLLSMMVSVPLANLLGLSGLFWLTAVMGLVGMGLVLTTPRKLPIQLEEEDAAVLSMTPVWLLSVCNFVLHAIMTMLFVILPGQLILNYGFELPQHWKLYVPTMIGSVIIMLPVLMKVGARKRESSILPWSFAALGVSLFALSANPSLAWLSVCVLIYFLGFNLLEACMPSLLSRLTGRGGRGRKMGLYSSLQFLGAFTGGAGGGILLATLGGATTLAIAGFICGAWAVVIGLLSRRVFPTGGVA